MSVMVLDAVSRRFPVRRGLLDMIMRRPAPALQAVRNVSLALREGETLGIVGESGCGKSTLARLAVGLQTPDEGSVAFGGKLMTGPDPDGRVQMVFQDPYSSLNPRMTIGAQLDEVVARYRPDVGRRERTAESRRLLDQVGMPPDAALKYPHALSGGQRQRVSIARALCPQPQVLVADEPVSALDASVQAQIINLFQRLSAERGIAIIFISHDMQVIRHLCDRVAVMYLGEVVELQAKAELFERPLHPYTRGLIDAVPDVTRRGRRSRKALSGEIPDPFSTIEGCRFSGRCPMAEAACSRQQTLRVIDGGGAVRCWKATPDPR